MWLLNADASDHISEPLAPQTKKQTLQIADIFSVYIWGRYHAVNSVQRKSIPDLSMLINVLH